MDIGIATIDCTCGALLVPPEDISPKRVAAFQIIKSYSSRATASAKAITAELWKQEASKIKAELLTTKESPDGFVFNFCRRELIAKTETAAGKLQLTCPKCGKICYSHVRGVLSQ